MDMLGGAHFLVFLCLLPTSGSLLLLQPEFNLRAMNSMSFLFDISNLEH